MKTPHYHTSTTQQIHQTHREGVRKKRRVDSLTQRRAGLLFTYKSRGLPPTAFSEIKTFFAPIQKSRQNRPCCGRSNELWVVRSRTFSPGIERGYHREGVGRYRTFVSAAGAELSSTTAAGQTLRTSGPPQTYSTAVLATTDTELRVYSSSPYH